MHREKIIIIEFVKSYIFTLVLESQKLPFNIHETSYSIKDFLYNSPTSPVNSFHFPLLIADLTRVSKVSLYNLRPLSGHRGSILCRSSLRGEGLP